MSYRLHQDHCPRCGGFGHRPGTCNWPLAQSVMS
jgi:hypothetical protein